jgi:hypothetical protein
MVGAFGGFFGYLSALKHAHLGGDLHAGVDTVIP